LAPSAILDLTGNGFSRFRRTKFHNAPVYQISTKSGNGRLVTNDSKHFLARFRGQNIHPIFSEMETEVYQILRGCRQIIKKQFSQITI